MSKKIITLFLICISYASSAQMMHPAHWTFKAGEIKNGEVELTFNVKLDKDWHIFSQFTPDGGPLPMVVTFEPDKSYSLVGKFEEPKAVVEYDSSFMVDVWTFHKEVTFKQKVKLNGGSGKIKGKIEYQACLEMCIMLDTTFSFNLGKVKTEIILPTKDTHSQNSNTNTPSEVIVVPQNSSDPSLSRLSTEINYHD